ncbi:hypothetical protein [Saccharopolyspora karakumensis]|uniref:hypothetical protein n=1 Tax=Saccharopolyspora karakumensis TaxID=2530386 RepID=UPI001404C180|nr:hypothetical protein [Saccharopolyspora karakumensis]
MKRSQAAVVDGRGGVHRPLDVQFHEFRYITSFPRRASDAIRTGTDPGEAPKVSEGR